jgi:glutathione S-transferase
MKLFVTPASGPVRKVRITIGELGIEDRIEIIQTRWPHSWGTQTVPFRPDFADATPVGRIPALVTDDGIRLTDSTVICDYLNAEHGGYRLCPVDGKRRWEIQSVVFIANGVLEAQAARRAETLRKKSERPQEYSRDFELKMLDRQSRCYQVLEEMCGGFASEADLGQIAVAAACGISDFRFAEDPWRRDFPKLARWYDTFRLRPSMVKTEPQETPTTPDDPARTPAAAAGAG